MRVAEPELDRSVGAKAVSGGDQTTPPDLRRARSSTERGSKGERSEARGARNVLIWVVGALLIAVPAIRLPDEGIWLGAKTLVLEAVGVLLAILAFSSRRWTGSRALAAAISGPNPLILGFLIWITLSAVRSELPTFSLPELMRHLGGVLVYFAVVYGAGGREHLRRLVGLLQLAATAGALMAFGAAVADEARVPIGAFRNEQLFAGFLCLLFPLLVMALVAEEVPTLRLAGQAPVILAGAGLLLTANRSAWIGTVVGLLVMGGLVLRYRMRPGRLRFQRHQLVSALVVVAASAALFLVVSQAGGGIAQRGSTLKSLEKDHNLQERMGSWRAATHMIRERPWFGWGVGTYPVQQALFNPFSRDQAEIFTRGGLSENAHNSYLQTAAELGLPGVLLYVGIPVAFLVTALRALKPMRRGYRQATLIGLIAGVVGQMVTAVANPAWEYPECSLFYWFVLGLGMVAAGLDSSQGVDATERPRTAFETNSRAESAGETVGARGT